MVYNTHIFKTSKFGSFSTPIPDKVSICKLQQENYTLDSNR